MKENKKKCEVHFKSTVYRWYNTLKKTLIKRNNNNKDLHFKCHSYIPCGWELYTFTHFFRWINYWITETVGGVLFLWEFSLTLKSWHFSHYKAELPRSANGTEMNVKALICKYYSIYLRARHCCPSWINPVNSCLSVCRAGAEAAAVSDSRGSGTLIQRWNESKQKSCSVWNHICCERRCGGTKHRHKSSTWVGGSNPGQSGETGAVVALR